MLFSPCLAFITIMSDCGGILKASESNSKSSQLPIRVKIYTEYVDGAFNYTVFLGKFPQIKIFHI